MDNYDEDLTENPFFRSLLHSHPDLFSECVQKKWILCIPRRDSLPKYTYNYEDFAHHILRPLGQSEKDEKTEKDENGQDIVHYWNYKSLADKYMELQGGTIILDVEIPPSPSDENSRITLLRKEILFQETFYTHTKQNYKIICIDSPLNSTANHVSSTHSYIWNLTSLRDCIDFLWSMDILETFDGSIKNFLISHSSMDTLPLNVQKDLVRSLYLKCLNFAVDSAKDGNQSKDHAQEISDFRLSRIKLATETYVVNGVYRTLMSSLTSVVGHEDAGLNKIIRNLSELHPADLEIDKGSWDKLDKAKYELSRINSYSSPLGKLTCLKRMTRYLRQDIRILANSSSSPSDVDENPLTTDKLIPLWVYLIVKNPIGNWIAQLELIRSFRFSCYGDENESLIGSAKKSDQESFIIATLEAALQHLKSGQVMGLTECEKDLGVPSDLGEAWLHHVHQNALENFPIMSEMLDAIKYGDCERLKKLINVYDASVQEDKIKLMNNNNNKINDAMLEEEEIILCHPLCDCMKCQKVKGPKDIASNDNNDKTNEENQTGALYLKTFDEQLTLLHMACIYGKPRVVDVLIDYGAPLEATDSLGMTALHYAASRGHQNAMLLLIHSGANLEPKNNTLDTPLHLAAQNGHESCVKALIYYAEHSRQSINTSCQNVNGDTPLHFASRWGFQSIVQLLAETGASITIPNNRHMTPMDCAHNVHVQQILHSSLQRRSYMHDSEHHGDFVNVEMVNKPRYGRGSGVFVFISEPKDEEPEDEFEAKEKDAVLALNNGIDSRRSSVVSRRTPVLVRSRKTSRIESDVKVSDNGIKNESNESELHDSDHHEFVKNEFVTVDPSESDHFNAVIVDNLEDASKRIEEQCFAGLKKARDRTDGELRKLFTAISLGDLPLALFYLGIPVEELENDDFIPESNIPCHPLCRCNKCVAKEAGLGFSLDVRSKDGYTPLHMSVRLGFTKLVQILIRYGADVNCESETEKKTALDFAVEVDMDEIIEILKQSGAQTSSSFCPMNVNEC